MFIGTPLFWYSISVLSLYQHARFLYIVNIVLPSTCTLFHSSHIFHGMYHCLLWKRDGLPTHPLTFGPAPSELLNFWYVIAQSVEIKTTWLQALTINHANDAPGFFICKHAQVVIVLCNFILIHHSNHIVEKSLAPFNLSWSNSTSSLIITLAQEGWLAFLAFLLNSHANPLGLLSFLILPKSTKPWHFLWPSAMIVHSFLLDL